MGYSKGFRKSIVRRLLQPGAPSITALAAETGISAQSLYGWLTKLKEDVKMSAHNRTADEWSLPEKNVAQLELAALTGDAKGEWPRRHEACRVGSHMDVVAALLRRNGLLSDHLADWHREIQSALTSAAMPVAKGTQTAARKQISELQKEILRKDRALAEMTALVVLKKKLHHLLSDEDL